MLEYGPNGLIGVLTPQANTTAEPELHILCPAGYSIITARLTSTKQTIDARLVDYLAGVEETLDRFANAPLSVVAFACTGASYLIEPDREAENIADLRKRRGYPLITAAGAVFDALRVLGAARVGLVSPYAGSLHEACLAYWPKRGITVARVARIDSDDTAFHPIYVLSSGDSGGAAEAVASEVDAVAILGTGLPTLKAIQRMAGGPVPVVSPNLCLMWRAVHAMEGSAPSADRLRSWLSADRWGKRLDELAAG